MMADSVHSVDAVLADGSMAGFGPLALEEVAVRARRDSLEGRIYAQIPGIVDGVMDEILTNLLDRLGMQRFEDAIPSRFDDAFRYGAAVVRALAPAPDLLVMERPREGLGEEGTSLLPDLWKERVTNRGGAVLLLVESGETATALADRVLLFRKNGTIEETETTRSDARRETEK